MADESIQVGAVVQLKSGGPAMTVQSIKDTNVVCQWFEKDQLEVGAFQTHSLMPYKAPSW